MKNSKTNLIKRIIPLMLAVMLVASAVFVPNLVSAATEEEYTALGLHAPTEYDFNDNTLPSAMTSNIFTTKVEDGALYTLRSSSTEKLRFDAYGDIETLSFDIKVDTPTQATHYTNGIVYYEETYTADDGTTEVTAKSYVDFCYSNNAWTVRSNGTNLSQYYANSTLTAVFPEDFDFTKNWLTVTLVYGTSFDYKGTAQNQKYITNIIFSYGDNELANYAIGEHYTHQYAYYGVDTSKKTSGVDNETVSLGIDAAGQSQIGTYIDNIKVTYRNTEKVIALIDAIGDVALNDTCKAAIEKAEAAYALLEAEQQSAVTNYTTLTAARASYNELAQNADVAEVINKIAAIGTVNASAECLAKIEAAEKAYAALTAEKQAKVTNYKALVNARADYINAKYGIHMAETIDLTDSVSTTVEGTTENNLTVNGTSNNAYYNAYGDINTVSYDMYVHSTATTGTVATPVFRYYDFDANTYDSTNAKDSIIFSLQNGTLKIFSGEGWPEYDTQITDYSTIFGKWVTVEYTYSTEYEKTRGDNSRKYIKNITIKDGDTTIVDWDITKSKNVPYYEWMLGYGIDILNYPDAKDPETVKIGFAGNNIETDFRNLKITYRDNASKVIGYIDAIGTVEATDECLEKIVYAEEAYAILTDAEKAQVTNYATLTAAKDTYNNLVENADVFAVIDKIDAIGTVEVSETCLAKIEAAEDAYKALSTAKQALVTNYATLVKARADYNKAYAAQYGIHYDDVIDFAKYASATTNVDGSNNTAITSDTLPLRANNDEKIYYNVYGDIDTVSFDMNLQSTNTGSFFSPRFYHYVDDANNTNYIQFQFDKTNAKTQILGSENGWFEITNNGETVDLFDKVIGNTVKVELSYSDADDLYDRTSISQGKGKYLNAITLKSASGDTLLSYAPADNDNWTKYRLRYGVDVTGEAKDSETVKIAFNTTNTSTNTITNLKVTYKNTAATEKVNAINTLKIDNTAACAEKVADIKATYALLDASQKTDELTAAIASAEAAVKVAKSAEAPVMEGASIRATKLTEAQNICFNSTMPTAGIEGYRVAEYGTVMFPTQLIGTNEELTLDTVNGEDSVVTAATVVNEGETAPGKWTSELSKIDVTGTNCGVRISARSYVKYTNGTTTIIIYSTNDKTGYNAEDKTTGVNGGVASRSVFSTARAMANAVLNTDTYPTDTFGSINGEIDLSTAKGAEVLAFVYDNQARIGKIAG